MGNLTPDDLAAIEAVELSKKRYRMNEIGIAKMKNMELTHSEKTGEKPKLQKLRHHKDIAKLEELCKGSY